MGLLTDEHRAWIGREEPLATVEVSRRDIQKYAAATEQQLQKFLDGDEAPPMFIFNLFSPIPQLADLREDGLARRAVAGPSLPLKRVMAGGTQVEIHRAIVPGDVLSATRTLTGMSEKDGRSGPLILLDYIIRIVDVNGQPVAEEHQTSIVR